MKDFYTIEEVAVFTGLTYSHFAVDLDSYVAVALRNCEHGIFTYKVDGVFNCLLNYSLTVFVFYGVLRENFRAHKGQRVVAAVEHRRTTRSFRRDARLYCTSSR